MKYLQFKINNYKGIPEIVLNLDRTPNVNVTTLVGLNESGKTSILEAIDLFQNNIKKENAHTLIPKSKQYSFNDSVKIEATIELNEQDMSKITIFLLDTYKFRLSNKEESKIIKITKKYTFVDSNPEEDFLKVEWEENFIGKAKNASNEKKLHDSKKDAWNELFEKINNEFLPKILYYEDFLFKFPEKIYLESFDGEGEEQSQYRAIIQDILWAIDNNLSTDIHLVDRMKNSNDKGYNDALEQLLDKMAEKINVEILNKWDDIFGNRQTKSVVIKYNQEEREKYYLEIRIKQGSDNYSINDRSLGFRWFFSFLIFTAFRKSRADDPGETLFLLDEPASNLHQKSQQQLLESIEDIFSDCKLIYSTHSHHLVNPKWLSGTYIVKNNAINYGNLEESSITETKVSATLYKNFVASHPNEEDHFKPILDSLDYCPSRLELVPKIVFTEGKNDYYTFKYMANIIMKDKYKLNFYPGAGVDKYENIFRLYLSWGREFIAIFDADRGGVEARKKYTDNIGVDVENKLFTLDDVDTKYDSFTTENLFTDADKLNVIQYSFPDCVGYDKSKFNTSIHQLYIDNFHFDFDKETLSKFESIFEFLQKKLNKDS